MNNLPNGWRLFIQWTSPGFYITLLVVGTLGAIAGIIHQTRHLFKH